jgi:hypothetical protein
MKPTTYPCGGLRYRSVAGGSIHAAGRPSSFDASWPAVTNSLRVSLVAVERGHGSGSMMVMDCGGAMRISEGGLEREANAIRRRRSKRGSESEAEGARAMDAKC